MAESATRKKDRLFINVPPGFRRQVKARAALEGVTVSDWVFGLILDELAEEEDTRIALERLAHPEEPIPWEEVKRAREALERKRALSHQV